MAAPSSYEKLNATLLMRSAPGEYATFSEMMEAVRDPTGKERTEAEMKKAVVINRENRYASVAVKVGATLDELDCALRKCRVEYKPVPTNEELQEKLEYVMSLRPATSEES